MIPESNTVREFIEEVLFYVQMNIVQDTWWDLEEVRGEIYC
jgi:hypothetical protein